MSMNIFNAETGELEQVAGYQPTTDKVEIGNMNSVTSNAVKKELNSLANTVNTKASQTDLNALSSSVSNLITYSNGILTINL